jgi:16S rRNA (uracil1498-N3)-methyltransferase
LAPAIVEKIVASYPPQLLVRLTGSFEKSQGQRCGPKLALALLKNPRFDWVVEKVTELGASRLTPLTCVRSIPSGQGALKKARWARLSEEARKQCGRPEPLIIDEPQSLIKFLDQSLSGPTLLLDFNGEPWPTEAAFHSVVIVGPEGGFTEEEKALIVDKGFRPVNVGSVRLRAETAALASMVLLAALGL